MIEFHLIGLETISKQLIVKANQWNKLCDNDLIC